MPLEIFRRGGIWHCRGTVGPAGRRKRFRQSLHTSDKDTAARQASEIEKKYWDGHFDGPSAVLTFAYAAQLYRNAGKSDRFLAPVENYLGHTLVRDITEGHVQAMARELYPNCSGASLNRLVLVPVRAVINLAAKQKLCSRFEIESYKTETKIKEPATLEWVEAFMKNAGPHLGAMALFMFLTGARVGEACALRPEDVNLREATAKIRQTKTSVERISDLPPPLVAAMANIQPVAGRVFGYVHAANLRTAWRTVVARAGIKHLSPHSCRHGFATGLLHAGVDVVTISWLGGWKSPSMVLRIYGHANKDPRLVRLLLDTPRAQSDVRDGKNIDRPNVYRIKSLP
jgi:site-specific recombinase XerD